MNHNSTSYSRLAARGVGSKSPAFSPFASRSSSIHKSAKDLTYYDMLPITKNISLVHVRPKKKLRKHVQPQKLPSSIGERPRFKLLRIVGVGGFGKVWKVEHIPSRQIFALKLMSKAVVIKKKSVESIINQQKLLERIQFPFIVNCLYAYQTRFHLNLVLEYMSGGDLRYYLNIGKEFNEEESRFMLACVICGLQRLRECNVIHRDLKPENLVFDSSGYLHITDFGVARQYSENNQSETSGTPGYMSPEVICKMNHSFESDYFALGVILHEIIIGRVNCQQAALPRQEPTVDPGEHPGKAGAGVARLSRVVTGGNKLHKLAAPAQGCPQTRALVNKLAGEAPVDEKNQFFETS